MTDLNYAVTVVANADHNGTLDYMYGWVGWWTIFPLVMMIFMLLMMSRMFFSRRTGSGGRSGMGPICMGPMGGMSGHGDEHETADNSALGLLRRRYASGELTDEQFDMMREKLEEP
jgi:uncharacterized membrane protein